MHYTIDSYSSFKLVLLAKDRQMKIVYCIWKSNNNYTFRLFYLFMTVPKVEIT